MRGPAIHRERGADRFLERQAVAKRGAVRTHRALAPWLASVMATELTSAFWSP
jgi:hypothetical protein